MKRRNICFILIGAISTAVILWLGIAPISANVKAMATPTQVAVVDIYEITSGYQRSMDSKEKFAKRAKDKQDELRRKADRAEALRADLASFTPESKDYRERQEELIKLSVELQVAGQVAEKVIQVEMRAEAEDIYSDILQAVEEIAKEGGYDLVLTKDVPKAKRAKIPMAMRRVLYAGKNLDITETVLARLNQKYQLRQVEETKP